MLPLVIICLLVGLLVHVWSLRKREVTKASYAVEEYEKWAFLDTGKGPVPHSFTIGDSPKSNVKTCQVRAIQEVRGQIGWVSDSPANRLVVGRLIRESMKEAGMRNLHVARWSPVAIELFFAPTSEDILAMNVRKEVVASRKRNGIVNAVH